MKADAFTVLTTIDEIDPDTLKENVEDIDLIFSSRQVPSGPA